MSRTGAPFGVPDVQAGMPECPYAYSSMMHWHPRVERLDIPQPETHMVQIPYADFVGMIDGGITLTPYMDRISRILERLEPFPVFLRTDHSSQKHGFRSTCRLPSKHSVTGHVLEIINRNLAADLHDTALVFRRWLDLDAGFAAFNGLPISIEARVFADERGVRCMHPYWPEGAIADWAASNPEWQAANPDWREILGMQNRTAESSGDLLYRYAEMVMEAMGTGYWSIDFALGRDGRWYLIDMAAGQVSFHMSGCGDMP